VIQGDTNVDSASSCESLLWLNDTRTLTDAAVAAHASRLSEAERERAGRFVRPARKRQFIVGRTLLRMALARLLDINVRDIALLERPGQAPSLLVPDQEHIGLSISHSGSWVGCAVSKVSRVGFDIELIDPSRNIDMLGEHAFDERQRASLASCPADCRIRHFYDLWSTVEARFKLGMAPASTFEFKHPELSVVLCCEHALLRCPDLEEVSLPALAD